MSQESPRVVIGHLYHGEPAQKPLGLDVGSVGDHQGGTGGVGAVDRTVLLLQPPAKTYTSAAFTASTTAHSLAHRLQRALTAATCSIDVTTEV
ncbi:MAG TPA: hypothetical protein VFX53_04855 [Pedococcus sp.]|nr:hypothetical protein [Pedococcus sp.]